MLGHLEYYIYGGYGPTNEKLAVYMKDLMGPDGENAAERWANGDTPGIKLYFNLAYEFTGVASVQKQTQSLVLAPQLDNHLRFCRYLLRIEQYYFRRITDKSTLEESSLDVDSVDDIKSPNSIRRKE